MSLEKLERRDCPAAIGIVGSSDVSEASGVATITVTLSAAEKKPVSVDYRVEGTATSGSDYRLVSGASNAGFPTGTITFKPGEVAKTLTVRVIDDIDRESSETVKVSLFKPRNATLDGSPSATVTILDDDSYTARIRGTSRINEGETGVYEIVLSSPATRIETFYVNTVPGTATQGIDYRPLTQMPLVINKGETRKSFRVQALQDAVSEIDEFLFLAAAPASRGFPAVSNAGVTIAGTGPSVVPQIAIADSTVLEGNNGLTALTFTVSLSSFFGTPVVVSYATKDGTATVADRDYTAATGAVTIAPGETSATVTIFVNADTKIEPDETLTVMLTSPINGILRDDVAVGTIVNDDYDAATGYQITLTYDNPALPASQKFVFERAVQRLQTIIVGDIPDVPAGNRTIDDMEIRVYVETMPTALNGYAMATAWRPGTAGLPYQGEIHINASRIGNPGIYFTVIHEMLHALGFYDRFFSQTGTIVGLGTNAPLFTGVNATREYNSYFGLASSAGVPLYEDPTAQGSYASHWSTSVIGTEIMSVGWNTASTELRPFSRITVGAMQDIGYTVNYAAADPYAPPADVATISPRAAAAFPKNANGDLDRLAMFGSLAASIASEQQSTNRSVSRQRVFATALL
jgi:hypothetical protein